MRAELGRRYRPPGITILPALRPTTTGERGFGTPRSFRWRRVNGRSTGAAGGGGEEEVDDAVENVSDRPGVSSSSSPPSSMSMSSLGRLRFAALSDACDDPDDSSNERLGDRRDDVGSGSGEMDRDGGRGIWEGVGGAGVGRRALDEVFDALALDGGFDFGLGGGGRSSMSTASISRTCGIPWWGPRRFRMEEKCSQS